ncbi:hypothetical protein Scep_003768 [Stephania cephalantha]|uniref:Uncharacterized protein n=1 Tax=Stephania cephalantha TaxID=152367 RepID=A0AAP0PWM6_9MAGN
MRRPAEEASSSNGRDEQRRRRRRAAADEDSSGGATLGPMASTCEQRVESRKERGGGVAEDCLITLADDGVDDGGDGAGDDDARSRG